MTANAPAYHYTIFLFVIGILQKSRMLFTNGASYNICYNPQTLIIGMDVSVTANTLAYNYLRVLFVLGIFQVIHKFLQMEHLKVFASSLDCKYYAWM